MDFKQRFKGKVSTMNKEGVLGIIKLPGQPIDKFMVSPQIIKVSQQEQRNDHEPQETYEDNDFKKNMLSKSEKYRPSNIFQQSQQPQPQINNNLKQQDPTPAKVFTHIQSNRNSKSYHASTSKAFKNNAQMVLRNHQSQEPLFNEIKDQHLRHRQSEQVPNMDSMLLSFQQSSMPLKYPGNFEGLNMDEYDIIAVPKRNMNNQMYNTNQMHQSNYNIQRMPINNNSQLFRATTNEVENYQNSHFSPLIKTYSYDPRFRQNNTEQRQPQRFNTNDKGKNNRSSLMQAGMGSLGQNQETRISRAQIN